MSRPAAVAQSGGEKRAIVHVGLPKTATTFLQNRVFSQIHGLNYLGRTRQTGPVDVLAEHICKADPVSGYGANLVELRDACLRHHPDAGKPYLLSVEDFSTVRTSLLVAGYRGERLCDRITIARRLESLFPGARIIVSVRRHEALLDSFYRYVIERNRRYVSPARWFPENAKMGGMLDTFHMAPLVETYDRIFGAQNVLVLPYEWLIGDRARFFDTLFGFMGVPLSDEELTALVAIAGQQRVNARSDGESTARYMVRERRGGRFLARLPAFLLRGLVDLTRWENEIARCIETVTPRFIEDAHALQSLRPELDLDALGYFGEPSR